MELTLQIDDAHAKLLEAEAHRSGESITERASHLLIASLTATNEVSRQPFEVKPFALIPPEKWSNLTPSQILDEMDLEEYREHLERA